MSDRIPTDQTDHPSDAVIAESVDLRRRLDEQSVQLAVILARIETKLDLRRRTRDAR